MRSRISERGVLIAVCLGLTALVGFVFGQTIRFPFANFDDPEYVYEVPEINSGLSWHNVKWAFTHWPATNWFPLKNISLMLDFQLFGSNPGLFHLTNVLLHAVTVILVFMVLRQMTGAIWKSAFVTAIFAIHPLRVESVVWIEERKDVLSGFFFILTVATYRLYVRRPSFARYLSMSILFAGGLLSKPMVVTTPFILLLLDYWPLGRLNDRRDVGKLFVEKIPLFLLAVAGAFLSAGGIANAHSAADQLSFLARVGNAIASYGVYIAQMLWPTRLGIFYPYPHNGWPVWQIMICAVTLSLITLLVIALRRSQPYLFVGWFWYLIMLGPVIGIIQINLQAHADRYTYLPQIGLLIMIVWGAADVAANLRYRPQIITAAAVVVIFAAALIARVQASYWRDNETLWNHTIAVTRDNYFAHASLSDLLMRRGRVDEAIEHSEEALRIRPNDADAQNNLGLAMLQRGETKGAVMHLEKALEINPGHMNAEVNLAWVLATASDDSLRNGARAVQLAEDVASRAGHENAIVLRTLSAAYAEVGRFNDATETADQAIQIAIHTGNQGLAFDLERNLEAYRLSRPIRSKP